MDGVAQRSEKRRPLIYYLKVFRVDTGELLGHLVDITHNGIMVLAREPFDIGWETAVRIELPSPYQGRDDIRLTVASRWYRKDVNPLYFLTGFQITAVDQAELATIDYLLEGCAFQG